MKFRNWNLLALNILIACSTAPKMAHEKHQSHSYRKVASVAMVSQQNVEKAIKRIFHSYLLGQVLLTDFDKHLDKHPKSALKSKAYHELMAIRTFVDHYEEEVSDMYINLVMIQALPEYSEDQKTNAAIALKTIGAFLDGIKTDKKELPENLKPLILGNLREKQTEIYDELMSISKDESITQNDPKVIEVINNNMALIRATRLSYYKDLKDYQVDLKVFNAVVEEVSKDKDFKDFKSEVKRTSQDIKKFMEDVRVGRSTSSDAIEPSADPKGNVTGRGYPANTWSITYDDGPGGKTSPTVLQNLKDRNLKATFFQLAKQVQSLPNTAMSIFEAGMDMACHSYDHAQLTKKGADLNKQITQAKKIIEDKYTKDPTRPFVIKLFRLPYGAGVSVPSIRARIAQDKMIHVFWNVDTLDWQDKNPTSILNRALKQMASEHNHGVILFHDIHPQSVIASRMLMDHMIEKKINICTVQGVIDQINKGLPDCK